MTAYVAMTHLSARILLSAASMNMVAVLLVLVLVTVLRLLELLTVLLWRDTSMAQPPHTSATHQHMLIMDHLGVEISS